LEEVSLAYNRTRIDAAAFVGGVLTGFEIKSAQDTLFRLKRQARRYRRYFRQLVLVASEHHIEAAADVLPGWWGVWVVSPVPTGFEVVRRRHPARPPRFNVRQRPESLAGLMWKRELMDCLEQGGDPGERQRLSELRRSQLAELAARRLTIETIEHAVYAALRSRPRRSPEQL
jgi:hypothetical protein